jgi:hypothetical protein
MRSAAIHKNASFVTWWSVALAASPVLANVTPRG